MLTPFCEADPQVAPALVLDTSATRDKNVVLAKGWSTTRMVIDASSRVGIEVRRACILLSLSFWCGGLTAGAGRRRGGYDQ